MKKAIFCKDVSEKFSGDAELYRMDPPLNGYEYVVSSAAMAMFTGPETYLFGADENGEVLDWMELDGSIRGVYDPEGAIETAGYVIVGKDDEE